jgi:hypothetical protein
VKRARIFEALDIPQNADDAEVARRLRRLLGASPAESPDPELWRRFLDMIDGTLKFPGGYDGDGAQLANSVVACSIVPPGGREEERWGIEAWDRELGVPFAESDDILREFVIDEIAPRLVSAGLYALN